MAYTPPPKFVDGGFLSAAQLNILSDDIEYIYGQSLTPVTGFYQRTVSAPNTGTTYSVGGWRFMNLTNTFRYKLKVSQGDVDFVRVRVNGTQVFYAADRNPVRSAGYEYTGTVSLTSLNLTIGEVYSASVDYRCYTSGTNNLLVVDLGENWPASNYAAQSTFNDGDVLTATRLNAIGTNIKALYGRALVPNVGFYSGPNLISFSDTGLPPEVSRGGWTQVHASNTLYYKVKLAAGQNGSWKININGTTVYTNSDTANVNNSGPVTWTGTVNLAPHNFALGSLLGIEVRFEGKTQNDSHQLNVMYIGEIW